MPSTKKILHFLGSGLLTACAIGLLGFSMSTEWADMNMNCAPREGSIYNNTGTAQLVLNLFDGQSFRIECPLFRPEDKFSVFEVLGELGGAPLILHVLSMGLLVVCMLCSVLSLLISLYNSVSNPYETYMGPVGFYACSSLSACLCLLVLIMFVVNVHLTGLAEDVSYHFINDKYLDTVELTDTAVEMQLGYYLLIVYIVLSLLGILSIFTYQHAAYTHRKEQQAPTEDAPKEIMMY